MKAFNPLMLSGLFFLTLSDRFISNLKSVCFFFLSFFIAITSLENPVLNANSLDPDGTPQNAVSDLGLDCLSMSLL